jgi:hypothetical protein
MIVDNLYFDRECTQAVPASNDVSLKRISSEMLIKREQASKATYFLKIIYRDVDEIGIVEVDIEVLSASIFVVPESKKKLIPNI